MHAKKYLFLDGTVQLCAELASKSNWNPKLSFSPTTSSLEGLEPEGMS